MSLVSVLAKPVELLWPARCAGCDRVVAEEAVFCGACALSINRVVGACPGCALPAGFAAAPQGSDDDRCGRCRRVPPPFASATAAVEYGEAVADAIVRTKHGGRRDLARRLARLLVEPLATVRARLALGGDDLVVPVPLHVGRLRARGFNQALELARWSLAEVRRKLRGAEGGSRKDGTTSSLPRLERNLLRRARATPDLGHAGPAARRAAVAGAFCVGDAERVRDRRVLLVDDVLTTGATASACAEALLDAGAGEVHVLALARAL